MQTFAPKEWLPEPYERPWKDSLQDLGVHFEGLQFFTFEDYVLFDAIWGGCSTRLTEAQLERDRLWLLDEAKNQEHMIHAHVESLLKAVEFWKKWYDEKYEEWRGLFHEAGERAFEDHPLFRNGGNSMEDEGFFEEEEGYWSD